MNNQDNIDHGAAPDETATRPAKEPHFAAFFLRQTPALIVGVAAFALALQSNVPNIQAEHNIAQGTEIKAETQAPSDFYMAAEAEPIPAPGPGIVSAQAFGPTMPPPERLQTSIRRGETLMEMLVNKGIPRNQAHQAIQAIGKHTNLRRLQIGQNVEIIREARLVPGEQTKLQELALRANFDTYIRASRAANGRYEVRTEQVETLEAATYRKGTIDDSLFLAADRVGIPDEITVELIRAFSFEVDFQREIWPGDGFEVYFTQRALPGSDEIDNGDILYASLTLKGKTKAYYRYTPSDDRRTDYFSPDGKSARRALMRTPVDGARLSSRFGPRRHPVLGYTRMHKGLDFAAPTGTPIMAAGDGIVERASRYGSYGNYVRIRHNGTYQTAYAHLSRYGRGIKSGTRVKQGQIIGYVGATGRVTGAHLHYEVHKDGSQTNPLRLNLPTGRALEGTELDNFNLLKAQIAGQISQYLLANTATDDAPTVEGTDAPSLPARSRSTEE